MELQDLSYPVQAIFRLFTNSETWVPLPIVCLDLEKGEAADNIPPDAAEMCIRDRSLAAKN